MALLTEKERKEHFEYLGYEYNADSIKKLQKMYLRSKDVDGVYGKDTDNLVRHLYNVKMYTKNFRPEEFKCECGGKYCCGYPTYMKPIELQHIQKIRDIYGKPITITSGMRCKTYNSKCGGSIQNSLHLCGYAVDFYQPGVTDTLANRKKSIKTIKVLPNHHYTYGNGINSNGYAGKAPYMGNALHTDTQPSVAPAPAPDPDKPITVDGIGGPATVAALQKLFGTAVDGVISGQNKNLRSYYPALKAVEYGKGGSPLVKKIQSWAGSSADGIWGQGTSKAIQRKLGVKADGIFGGESMKALQKYVNAQLFPDSSKDGKKEEPTIPSERIVIDVSEFQSAIDWAKVKAAGIEGVIVRCGYRGYEKGTLKEDPMFLNHVHGAQSAGLKLGVYFFTQAINYKEGVEEAVFTLNEIQKAGVSPYYPIAIDTEAISGGKGRADKISVERRTEAIQGFCSEIEKQGGRAMIYASTSWLNNKLDMNILPYDVWCAQYYSKCEYKGKYILWQYTSKGSVNGVKGNVDMSKCYIEEVSTAPAPAPTPVQEPKGYSGKLPTLKLKKSTDQVIADALIFGKWIVEDNRFGYGRKGGGKYKGTKEYSITHSGGCHFCGTNASKIKRAKKAGLSNPEEWEYTYVCNTFTHACYAHAGVAAMLKASNHSWWIKDYQNSKDWEEIKKPSKISSLKPGDVLGSDKHFCVYIGNGKGMEATSGPGGGNPASSKDAWAKSIRICDFSTRFKEATHIFRYTGTVNSSAPIRYGEVSDRVALLQKFLIWYGLLSNGSDDRIFGDKTLSAVKAFQKAAGIAVDGVAGSGTFAAMAKAVK